MALCNKNNFADYRTLKRKALLRDLLFGGLFFFFFFQVPLSFAKMPPQFSSNPEQEQTGNQQTSKPNTSPPRSVDRINVHSLGIGLGETFLMGDFANHGDDKITFDALYSYSASYSFDLLLDAHYSKHKKKQEQVSTQGIALGVKVKMYQFDNFAPFAVGGLGFYRPTVTRMVNNQLVESERKTTFGWHLGVGADLKLNPNYTIGVLSQYHHPFEVQQDVGPKVSGSYFKLMMTFMYSF